VAKRGSHPSICRGLPTAGHQAAVGAHLTSAADSVLFNPGAAQGLRTNGTASCAAPPRLTAFLYPGGKLIDRASLRAMALLQNYRMEPSLSAAFYPLARERVVDGCISGYCCECREWAPHSSSCNAGLRPSKPALEDSRSTLGLVQGQVVPPGFINAQTRAPGSCRPCSRQGLTVLLLVCFGVRARSPADSACANRCGAS